MSYAASGCNELLRNMEDARPCHAKIWCTCWQELAARTIHKLCRRRHDYSGSFSVCGPMVIQSHCHSSPLQGRPTTTPWSEKRCHNDCQKPSQTAPKNSAMNWSTCGLRVQKNNEASKVPAMTMGLAKVPLRKAHACRESPAHAEPGLFIRVDATHSQTLTCPGKLRIHNNTHPTKLSVRECK